MKIDILSRNFMEQPAHSKLFLWGMILSMTCWGFSWTAGKVLAGYGNPMTISFIRFACTFLSLVPLLPLLKTRFTIQRKGWFDLTMAAVMISLYTFLFFKGLVTGKAGAGGVLVTVLNPIVSYAIMLVMKRRRPTKNETIGLLLGAIAGIILTRLLTDPASMLHAGNIYFLCASFCWAILSLFTARSSRYGEPLSFSFFMYLISTIIMLFAAGISPVLDTFRQSDSRFWLNMFFSSTITTALATTFYFFATARIGASRASSFIFLVPFSAALGSWIFLTEQPEWHTLLGGMLGIVAVLVLNRKPRIA
jgi:drug/metabolite transporter (DMT)-like permease